MSEESVKNSFKALEDFWGQRTINIKAMYKLRLLEDTNKVTGYESIVANDPKTFFNLAQFMVSAVPAKHKLPIKKDSEATMDQKGVSERGLVSCWRNQDIKMLRQGKRPWRWEVADHMLISGWYGVYAGVFQDGEGKLDFVADVLNPINVFQEYGEDGLVQCGIKYARSAQATIAMIQEHIDAGEQNWKMPDFLKNIGSTQYAGDIAFSNYWGIQNKQVVNSILANGHTVMEETKLPNLTYIPIFTGPTGGEAAWGGWGEGDASWRKRYGESILQPNAGMYEHQSKMMTKLAKIVDRLAEPPIVDENASGDALLEADDVTAGKIIHRRTGDKAYGMEMPRTPPEIYAYQGMIEQKIQQGAVPYTLYGSVPPSLDLSGFAIGLLMTAAQNVVGPFQAALVGLMGEIDRTWLEGFKASGKTIEISGRSRGGDSGSVFFEDWKAEDVPDSVYVDVTVPLSTPSDLLERMTIARQAKPMGDLLDDITIYEEILNVDDPQLVKGRIDAQIFAQTPEVQMLKMVIEAKKKEAEFREDPEKAAYAEIMAAFAERIMGQLGGQGQGGGGQPNAPKPGIDSRVGGTEMSRGGPAEKEELFQRKGGQGGAA